MTYQSVAYAGGRVRVVSPPEAAAIDLADAKQHLRIEPGNLTEDALIEALITAANAPLDGPSGWLGRALVLQRLEYSLDGFPCDVLKLPCPPLAVDNLGVPLFVAVSYVDSQGALQTLAPATYRVIYGGEEPSRFLLGYGQTWPATRCEPEAVRIRYDAGYGTASEAVAAEIRHAVRLQVGTLYKNRESVIGTPQHDLLKGYVELLSHKRVFL